MTERRNHWGWGLVDEAPAAEELEDYAEFLEDELGFPERPVLDPVPIEEIDLRPPRVEPPTRLGSVCSAARLDRIDHTYGSSRADYVRGLRGSFEHPPDVVAFPEDEGDVRDLLAWATAERVAVVPYGGGTGLVGGTEVRVDDAYTGVVSIDLRRLDRVLEVDEVSRRAHIQAGVLGPDLNDQLADSGLHLRHYPQSYEFSTLGGWLATRSGGHYATRYTHIDDFLESARMVTPAGVFETNQVPASGAGPDPNRLLLGSEGALGVITEAWMRVEPRPTFRSDASVHFDAFDDAVRAVRNIVQAGLTPANCRLHDRNETRLYGMGIDAHLVVLGFESADRSTEAAADRAVALCRDEGGHVAEGPVHYGSGFGRERPTGEKGSMGRAFMRGPYTGNLNVRLAVVGGTIETAVTWDRFPGLHADLVGTLEAAVDRVCGTGIVTTRFTHVYPDGPAPYVRFFAAGTPGEEIEQHRTIKAAGMDVVRAHSLTSTHHHAVGRDHRPWYDDETPEAFGDVLRGVKRVLDPAGVMNPGVLVDP